MNKTKYTIAKGIYYAGMVVVIGLGLGLVIGLTWYVITTIPFMLAVVAGIAVLIGIGLIMGWAEDYIGRYEGYKKK